VIVLIVLCYLSLWSFFPKKISSQVNRRGADPILQHISWGNLQQRVWSSPSGRRTGYTTGGRLSQGHVRHRTPIIEDSVPGWPFFYWIALLLCIFPDLLSLNYFLLFPIFLVSCYRNYYLFQIQVERIRRLQELSEISTKKSGGKIMMYIMTSEHTKRPTEEFFENHNFFGLEKIQVFSLTEILLNNYGTL